MVITLDRELRTALTEVARRQGVQPEVLALEALRDRFLVSPGGGETSDRGSGDPLEAARARGEQVGAELLAEEGKPLNASEVGKILRTTSRRVEEMLAAGRLLAVDSGTKGHVFPSWQFVEHGLLPGIDEVLADLRGLSPWTQLQFFLNGNLRLDGASPLEELRRGKLAEVRCAARNYGEQGAV